MARVHKLLQVKFGDITAVAHLALLCTSSYSYDEAATGVPKGSDVIIMQCMREWGYLGLTITPVLIRHWVTVMEYEDHGYDKFETLRVVRASKGDLLAAVLGTPPEAAPPRHVVVVPRGAGDALAKAYRAELGSVVHTGNDGRSGYEDSRYWTCVIAGSRAPADPAPE